jgi:hypothetical protein
MIRQPSGRRSTTSVNTPRPAWAVPVSSQWPSTTAPSAPTGSIESIRNTSVPIAFGSVA